MLQRILGGALVLIGLVSVALGVASATVWRAPDRVVATAEPAGDGTMVVSDPGVLGLVNDDVTVTASVPEGQEVTLAVGRDVDVLGWVGDEPYSQVTGLADDWETLDVAEASAAEGEGDGDKGEAAKPSGADPAGSDMWVAESSDEGSTTLRWSDRPGRWTLLAAGVGDKAQAPTLTFTWPRPAPTPYLWPAVGAGAAFVVVGLVLFVVGTRRRRHEVADHGSVAGTPEPEGSGPDDARSHGSDAESERGEMSPFAPVHASGTAVADAPWAAPAAAGAAPETTALPAADVPRADHPQTDEPGADEPGEDVPEGSGTAEVPLAGRLLRRSRRRQAAAEPESGSGADDETAPAEPTGAAEGVAPAPALPVPGAEPPTATGSVPMTRRELRAQEEARRTAEEGGVSRMLRAITGSIPAVRQQPESEASADRATSSNEAPDLSTPAGRAAAWRATWGFGQTTQQHDTTDGENR